MDEKVSFIPKTTGIKPSYKNKGVGLFFATSFLVFLVSVLFLGGVYLYKQSLQNNVDLLASSLKKTKDILDTDFIEKVGELDNKIEKTKTLLAQHKAITPLFEFLQQNTISNIRFKEFELKMPILKKDNVILSLGGVSKSYNSLALQVDEFQKNKNIKSISNSDFSLGEKGLVNFKSIIEISPDFFYKQN